MNQEIHEQEQAKLMSAEDAAVYLDEVRRMYRKGAADYRGQRNPEQKQIAADAGAEADEYFNETLLGVIALATLGEEDPEEKLIEAIPSSDEESEIFLANNNESLSMTDMRDAWRQLWAGFSVMTNRLERDSEKFNALGLRQAASLSVEDKHTVMQTLFNQFQEINTYRFGVKGLGRMRKERKYDHEQDQWTEIKFDPDVARSDKGMSTIAGKRGYVANHEEGRPSVHTAGKMSPSELLQLSEHYPEDNADKFFFDTAFLKDAISAYHDTNPKE